VNPEPTSLRFGANRDDVMGHLHHLIGAVHDWENLLTTIVV
jgi:hypothetical protein